MRRARLGLVTVLLAIAACATGRGAGEPPPLPSGTSEEAAREVLRRFARAVEEARWPEAYALLSARWRAAYTPARLAADRDGAGPVAAEAAERVLALLAAGAPLEGGRERRTLPVGEGRAAVVVAEAGGWRVEALE